MVRSISPVVSFSTQSARNALKAVWVGVQLAAGVAPAALHHHRLASAPGTHRPGLALVHND
eukprot:3503088-Pyramimonas_sp.AAC.1